MPAAAEILSAAGSNGSTAANGGDDAGYGRSAPNRALFFCYLALLVWAPIPLGSNRAWSTALLEIWVFTLAAWWLVGFVLGRNYRSPVLLAAWPALLCCVLWLCYVWLQLLPWPIEVLRELSPEAARWHAAAAWPQPADRAPLTLDRYATYQAALKSAAYVTFFALSLALLDRSARIAGAAYALVVSGLGQAVYGVLWAHTPGSSRQLIASFANPNHLAGYLELCLSVGLGLLLARLTGEVSHTWRQRVRNVVAWIMSPSMLLRAALAIMVIGLILSRSRMGNAAFFSSMLVSGGILLLLSKYRTWSMVALLASLVVLDIYILGAYFGVERVVERLEQTSELDEYRASMTAHGLRMWKDYPLFGSGLGSLGTVFQSYADADLRGTIQTLLHNDYIQLACEAGVVGLVLLGALVLMSFAVALRAQRARSDPLMRGISFGSVMGIISLMTHSTVDFNLHIPSNALTFMLVLAFGWISLYHNRYRSSRGRTPRAGPLKGADEMPQSR